MLRRSERTPEGPQDLDSSESSGVTARAFLVGALLCLGIAVGVPYGGMVVQGTRLGLSSCTPAALFMLFVWLAIPQILLGLLNRKWMFRQGELITIYCMMVVATAIPTRGFTGMLLPMITGAYYYATPENNWAQDIHPYLPDWLVVKDVGGIKEFYEGFIHRETIPWEIWIGPVARWLVFIGAFYLFILSAMSILRRQWADHERLVYPMAQVPMAMIEDEGPIRLIKPFFKNPIMWAGFLIPFAFNSINALHNYFPYIPRVDPNTTLPLFRRTIVLRVRLNYLMLGFSYFINSGISLSLWFFYLFRMVQQGVFSIVGIGNSEELGPWTDSGEVISILAHQMIGAMIVMVLLGLWIARAHLRNVVRKALGKAPEVDDSGEVMSYRVAFFGTMFGLLVMGFWLWRSGVPGWIAPILLFSTFVIFVALARVISEAGLATVTPAMVPAGFVVSGVGVPALGHVGMIAIGYTFAWAGDLLVFMSAPVANAMKLAGAVRRNRRALFPAMAVAMVISLIASIAFTLHLGYKYGALNLHQQYFNTFAQYPSSFAASKILTPTGANLQGWLWTIFGGGCMVLLMLARHRFIWWPLHPLGFVVGYGWTMHNIWFSVFLAWLIKVVVLKYGGPKVYRLTRPFFLGIILGQFVVGGFWLVLDAFTGMTGNTVPVY